MLKEAPLEVELKGNSSHCNKCHCMLFLHIPVYFLNNGSRGFFFVCSLPPSFTKEKTSSTCKFQQNTKQLSGCQDRADLSKKAEGGVYLSVQGVFQVEKVS